jgi:hypothetical protein
MQTFKNNGVTLKYNDSEALLFSDNRKVEMYTVNNGETYTISLFVIKPSIFEKGQMEEHHTKIMTGLSQREALTYFGKKQKEFKFFS